MLIFDHFPNRPHANAFAATIRASTGREARVFMSQAESNAVDPYLFVLVPPIVLVPRAGSNAVDDAIEMAAYRFGGEFAGT